MKINITDTAALNAAIDEVAGKARQHIHTAPHVHDDSLALYAKLSRTLPKRLLLGSLIRLSSRPRLPKAYGARKVIHTVVEVEICPSGLFVVGITRHEEWATNTPGPIAWAVLPLAVQEHLKSELYRKEITL